MNSVAKCMICIRCPQYASQVCRSNFVILAKEWNMRSTSIPSQIRAKYASLVSVRRSYLAILATALLNEHFYSKYSPSSAKHVVNSDVYMLPNTLMPNKISTSVSAVAVAALLACLAERV